LELRVEKRSEDIKNGKFFVVLGGKSHEILSNCLIDVQLKLSGKYDDLIKLFPVNEPVIFKLEPK
jgi:hypothetical protein